MNYNHISSVPEFPCQIVGLRHGQSKANIKIVKGAERAGIIVSHPENGLKEEWGLTEAGRMKVKNSIRQALEDRILSKNVLIISSDFSRAKESALIAAKLLNVDTDEIQYNKSLRERFFGDLEGKSADNYQKVWDEDIRDPDSKKYGVESVNEVLERTTKVVHGLLDNPKISGKSVLLVSHGDPLQILETGFRKTPVSKHRSLPEIQTGEIRAYTPTYTPKTNQ